MARKKNNVIVPEGFVPPILDVIVPTESDISVVPEKKEIKIIVPDRYELPESSKIIVPKRP